MVPGRGEAGGAAACRSTRRTASTARRAISPIRTRSSPGSRPRAAAARTTRTSDVAGALASAPHRIAPRRVSWRIGALAVLTLLAIGAGSCATTPAVEPSSEPVTNSATYAARAGLRPEYRVFYDALVDYGDWVLIEPYGWVFRPRRRLRHVESRTGTASGRRPTCTVGCGCRASRSVGDLPLRPLAARRLSGMGVGAGRGLGAGVGGVEHDEQLRRLGAVEPGVVVDVGEPVDERAVPVRARQRARIHQHQGAGPQREGRARGTRGARDSSPTSPTPTASRSTAGRASVGSRPGGSASRARRSEDLVASETPRRSARA